MQLSQDSKQPRRVELAKKHAKANGTVQSGSGDDQCHHSERTGRGAIV